MLLVEDPMVDFVSVNLRLERGWRISGSALSVYLVIAWAAQFVCASAIRSQSRPQSRPRHDCFHRTGAHFDDAKPHAPL